MQQITAPVHAFAPAVPLRVIPSDRGRGFVGGGGDDLAYDVIAMCSYDNGENHYLVIHGQMFHPRWMTPDLVSHVVPA